MNLVALAQRIGRLRKERGLTLQQLADRSGLTRSVLSKVENFRVTPSLPALARISQALDVTMADLVRGLDEKPRMVVVRKSERQTMRRDSPESPLMYHALAHPRPQKAMEPFIVDVPPEVSREECLTHEAEEFLMVLEGDLVYDYGEEEVRLESGDSVYADGSVPHRVRNAGSGPGSILIVFAQPAGSAEDQ